MTLDWFGGGGLVSVSAIASLTSFFPVILAFQARAATAMPARPPRIAWSSRLPEPASRYPNTFMSSNSLAFASF